MLAYADGKFTLDDLESLSGMPRVTLEKAAGLLLDADLLDRID